MTMQISATAIVKRYGSQPGPLTRLAGRLNFTVEPKLVQALNGVSIDVRPGEVLGIVGESGCGKSTLGRVLAGLESPDEGSLTYEGRTLAELDRRERKTVQLASQVIFQDPWASLNPRWRIRQIIGEAPLVHGLVERRDLARHVTAMLTQVGLTEDYLDRFPHELSGGQRQRVGIARALAVSPRTLICDESVSALDVSIQAQILRLFRRLRNDLGISLVFISHDLSVVHNLSDRIAVMYLGRIVEIGTAQQIYEAPSHPYTQALIADAPRLSTQRRSFSVIRGELPSPYAPPSGCAFHTRCPKAFERCRLDVPATIATEPGRTVACHLYEEATIPA
ncbi:ABC transporter ATP-binding protein [Chelatococcus asaccharovorans]|uniref:Peptide/nickel transport system ATP-binding protein n=1 Tax=Chelatococcus asaccharovorans TaxID=28210 RepID=A0A2V3U4Q9_9HYPH|nr:oligopeptide/dipeptide ABC transporter ATP-binding protein [Chelatococcus asaccharovorans]MBS7703741.1 ATP-binding cassette domain-containing protein [Chelatococcus asaccharovorans]PXW57899.1 peptide/nickel transport system ATP-binding protein [Chelatococcus asaccharovorans]